MTEQIIEQLKTRNFRHETSDRWTGVYNLSSGVNDPLQQLPNLVSELIDDNDARGGRFGYSSIPGGHQIFMKQYHHGGLLANRGDVYFTSPKRFLNELLGTVRAKQQKVPVPEPVGVFWRREEEGYIGYYASKWVKSERATRTIRRKRNPELMERLGKFLARLHNAGIDHQDYKLDNILLTEQEQIYVTDFDPVRFGELTTIKREQRVHRFFRFLSKYGLDNGSESAFLNGYRSTVRNGSPFIFNTLRGPNWLRNRCSDLISHFFPGPLQPVDLEKILVRAPNWLGDSVMSLPFVQTLASELPQRTVDIICRASVHDVYRASNAVDQVWTIDEGKSTQFPEEIVNSRYSMALILPKSFRTALQAWRSNIPRRRGFATRFRSPLLTDRVPMDGQDRSIHHAWLYYELLPDSINKPDRLPNVKLSIPQEWKTNTPRDWYTGRFLTVHPGSAYGPAKRWPPPRFREFLKQVLHEQDLNITFLGVPSEREIVDRIKQGLPSDRINDLVGKTSLRQCMIILQESRATVANDSGLMHLSAALDIPVLALFGSSSPDLTSPLTPNREIIYRNVECSPCFERTCPRVSDEYRCLTEITPDMVYQRLIKLLSNTT